MISSGWNRFLGMTCLLRKKGPLLLYHWTNFRGQGYLNTQETVKFAAGGSSRRDDTDRNL